MDTYGHWLPGEGKLDLGKTLRQATSLARVQETSPSGSRQELGRRLALVGGSPNGARVAQCSQGGELKALQVHREVLGKKLGKNGGTRSQERRNPKDYA